MSFFSIHLNLLFNIHVQGTNSIFLNSTPTHFSLKEYNYMYIYGIYSIYRVSAIDINERELRAFCATCSFDYYTSFWVVLPSPSRFSHFQSPNHPHLPISFLGLGIDHTSVVVHHFSPNIDPTWRY